MTILVLFLWLFFALEASQGECLYYINFVTGSLHGLLVEQPQASFYCNTLQIDADIPVFYHELAVYIDFYLRSTIDISLCKKLAHYISLKKKFKTLELTLEKVGEHEACLHLALESLWTVGRITVTGPLFHKEMYRRLYTLKEGEQFQEKQHIASCEHIKKTCYGQGYCDARCSSGLTPRAATKTFDITLMINLGKRYTISELNCQTLPPIISEFERKLIDNIQKKIFDKHIGNYYSQQVCNEIEESLKKMLCEHGYYNACISCKESINKIDAQIGLIYTLKCLTQTRFIWRGNSFFSSQYLENIIASSWRMIDITPEMLEEDIKKVYHDEGFFDVQVIVALENTVSEERQIYITISENNRAYIDQIYVSGLDKISERSIRDFFKVHINNYYSHSLIETVCNHLSDRCRAQGYWDIKLMHSLNKNKSGSYTLEIAVDEAKQYMLDGVPIDPDNLQKLRQEKIQKLQGEGYLYANSNLIYQEKNKNTRSVDLAIISGDRVHFGKTIPIGNNYFLSDRLLDHLGYYEGDVWDGRALDKTIKNLMLHPVFDHISISPVHRQITETCKDIMLSYHSDDGQEVKIRGGFQWVGRHLHIHRITPKAGISYLIKNPSSYGDCLACDIDATYYFRDINVRYILPFFRKFSGKIDISGYSMCYDQPFHIGSPDILYQSEQDGFALSVQRVCTDFMYSINGGIEWQGLKHLSRHLAEKIDFAPWLIDSRIAYVLIEPTIVADRLLEKVKPEGGSYSVISCKAMFPPHLFDGYLIKVLLEHSFFMQLWRDYVLGVRIRAGHIFNQRFSTIVPPLRFFLGGAFSMRGYLADLVPPLNVYVDCSGCQRVVPVGGKSMVNINAEIRFPLYKSLYGVIFNDMGALAQDTMSDIYSKNIVGSTGFGMRIYTPVGPLRADIAWKWKKSFASDCSFAWFITLGNTF